jgi:general secretion pathway protein K
LLAVLWLSAALSAIAFTVANTVRGETERTATAADGVRAYYLASGAVQRAALYVLWGQNFRNPDGTPRFYDRGTPFFRMRFETGEAMVEVIPEASRLNVNTATPEELFRLLVVVGVDAVRAREMAMAIIDWRTPMPGGLSPFDQDYLSLSPSFRGRHASFEEIEEVLLIKGMTPELFYGTYAPDGGGGLVPRGGLRDCLTVFGADNGIDINTAEPAVLQSLGLAPGAVAAIVNQRQNMPFREPGQVTPYSQSGGPGVHKLRIGGNSIFTFRATARLRLPDGRFSDIRKTVTSTVKFLPTGFDQPFHILRWNEGAR